MKKLSQSNMLPARHTSSIAHPHIGRGRLRAELGLNLANPIMQTPLDLINSFELPEMTGLIEVLEIGT